MDQSGLREERASLLWAVKASRERNTRWKASLAACNSGSLVSFRTAVLPHDGLVARAVSSTTPLGSASWLGAVEGGGAEAEVATGPMSHPTSHGCNAHTQNTSNGKGMMRKLALVVKMSETGKLGRKRLPGRERVGGCRRFGVVEGRSLVPSASVRVGVVGRGVVCYTRLSRPCLAGTKRGESPS